MLRPGDFELHFIQLEWYETQRTLIIRKSDRGLLIRIEKESKVAFDHGDVIYDQGAIRVIVQIKVCDTIVLYPRSLTETGMICFEIGNQHIPIFINEKNEIMAAYDANLYQLLDSGSFQIKLENRRLRPNQMVKAYGNFF